MFFLKILLIKIIKLKKLFAYQKRSINEETLFISIAGIGDSIYLLSAIQYYNQLTSNNVDILISKSSIDIFYNCDYVNKIYINENNILIDFKKYKYIFSNRTDLPRLVEIIKSGFSNYFYENPNYERLRIIARLKCKFSQSFKKKYFTKFHAGLQMNLVLKSIFKTKLDFPKPKIQSIKPNGDLINNFLIQNINFGILHVAGQDDIRKIHPDLIYDLTINLRKPLILVGSNNDSLYYYKKKY